MIKKITAAFLSVLLIFSAAACAPTLTESPLQTGSISENTPAPPLPTPSAEPVLPDYPEEKIHLTNLSEYVIVYPSYYNEYRMNEVKLLQSAIKNVTGAELEIISDGEQAHEHEIIFASSKRQNGVEESISMFESGLDYVVGALNGNIILGGNNFYADMRAVYDFINNYLGYNDIDNIYSEPKSEISGVNLHIYQKPLLTIMASNYSVSAFTEQYAIRDMHDACFNMTMVEAGAYSKDELIDLVKWCARYEIFLIMRSIRFVDEYTDCPIIWGHTVRDEPHVKDYIMYSQQCEDYAEKYSQYGWHPWVNYMGWPQYWPMLNETESLFDAVPVVSFDRYFGENILQESELLEIFEYMRDLAQRKGQEMWSYIESYNITNRGQNTSKMLRWSAYVSLCFGARGILHFQYGDCSPNYTAEGDWTKGSLVNWDYTKNQAWYDAKTTNEELLKLAQIYTQYETVGAHVINRKAKDTSVYLEDQYPYVSDFISDFKDSDDAIKDTYLLSLFEKTYSDGKAVILMNLEDIDDIPYEEDEAEYVKIKLNCENPVFYRNGEPQNVEKDSDGYYVLNMANGYCWFITLD